MRIHDGMLEEFKAVAAEILSLVHDHGPDTLEYEWFMSGDQTECVVLETFRDSEALLAHAELIAEQAQRLFAAGEIKNLWLCGNPSAEVVEKTSAFAPGLYNFLQGRE
jgi:quinol monooxygenase YgiN